MFGSVLEETNLDWSQQTIYHRNHKVLDTPNLANSSVSVTSRGDRPMRAIMFVYIIEAAHTDAQNASVEWFWSTIGLGVMPRPISKICWLCIRLSTFVVLYRFKNS